MQLCSMLCGASATQLTTVLLAGGATDMLRVLGSGGIAQICRLAQSRAKNARQVAAHVPSMTLAPAEESAAAWQHVQSANWPSHAHGSSGAALMRFNRAPVGAGIHTYRSSSSSSSRGFATTNYAADGSDPADAPRRRRRSATESQAALRRTTESRAAIEDVAVMTRSQLLRRNKPWLAEQCWQHGLSHDGLKEDLIQRLLAWQGTESGQQAATAAHEAAAAARAAVAAATAAAAAAPSVSAAAAAAPAAAPPAAAGGQHTQQGPPGHSSTSTSPAAAAVLPSPAAAAVAASAADTDAGSMHAPGSRLARPAAGACAAAVALPADLECNEAEAHDNATHYDAAAAAAAALTGISSDPAADPSSGSSAPAAAQGGVVGWQAPRSAAAAAAGSMGLFLGQLQEQPRNAALVATARSSVEQYTNQLLSTASSSGSGSGSGSTQQLVAQLAATVSQHSSPQSLAALAKACYSREIQHPVLAASLAQAVAAVAAQLGPQEVYGVLRLLVEHLGSEAEDAVGFSTMDRGFRVLAEAMIRCSEALKPVQLAEAVQLLGVHGYDDAFGLWMIAKEAAARVIEFDPVKEGGSVVILLDAIAGMHVADDAMTSDVAAAVAARRGEYSQQQLASIGAALQRMGCTTDL